MSVRKKICMLGGFAVGKTSLVRRFVSSIFSDTYQTTVGVHIEKKDVQLGEREVTLMLWDLHGEDELQSVRSSYLRGSSGLLFVADGTRAATLDVVLALRQRARDTIGDVPAILLVNKCDLPECELDDERLQALQDEGWTVLRTSAKTGEHVEQAFVELTARMVAD